MSESITLGDGEGFCVSTGTEEENYIYWPQRVTSIEIAEEAAKFFRERGETFMWPLTERYGEALERAGLVYAGDLTAMSFEAADVRAEQSVSVEPADAEKWAGLSWRGFGGEDEPPDEYVEFVRAMAEDTENLRLYTAEDAGAFLLTNEPDVTGVYYFAVVPEFRRRGVARGMMNEIVRLSAGRKIVLQSTPMGLNFYRSFGYRELFKIPVYSTEQDIF